MAANCDLAIDPVDTFSGPASVTYRICDQHTLLNTTIAADPYGDPDGRQPGDPAPRCATAVVTMNVAQELEDQGPASNPPQCVDDLRFTPLDTDVVIDVLANDSDLDSDGQPSPLTALPPDDLNTAQGGTVSLLGNAIGYSPKPGFKGVDSFLYSAIDTDGQGCTATVTVLVGLSDSPAPALDPRALAIALAMLAGVAFLRLRCRTT